MVYKEEVLQWFKKLSPSYRIDVMCALINMCNPLELRYFGTCVENLGRRDFIYLRDAELQANNADNVAKLINIHDDAIRSKLMVTLALLHSCQVSCSDVIFRTLTSLDTLKKMHNAPRDVKFIRELFLLLTMASHHPVFSFDQRTVLHTHLSMLLQMYKDNMTGMVEESDEDWVYSDENTPVQTSYTKNQTYVRNLELEGMQWKKAYRISVTWSSGEVTQVYKTYQELHDFHLKLIQLTVGNLHQNDGHLPTIIPFFPDSASAISKNSVEKTEEILPPMAEYLRRLVSCLSSNPTVCDHVTSFFGGHSPELSSSQNFCPFKSSQTVPRVNTKDLATVPSSSLVMRTSPILETNLVTSTTSANPTSGGAPPVHGSISHPVMIGPFPTTTSTHGQVGASPVTIAATSNNKAKPPKGLAQANVNTTVPSITSANVSLNCNKNNSQLELCSFSRSSSSSPYSSPTASVTNSRCTSPRIRVFHSGSTTHHSGSDSQRINEQQVLSEEFKKERIRKYSDMLKDYSVEELKKMSDEDLIAMNIRQGAINRLRKILDNFPNNLNGVNLPNTSLILSNNDLTSKRCSSSSANVHPSSRQSPPVVITQINTKVTATSCESNAIPRPTSLIPASQPKPIGCITSVHKPSCVVSPSQPDVANIPQTISSVSILQAPPNPAVPKNLPNTVMMRTPPYHGGSSKPQFSLPSGSNDSSSSSEYSSSPPSPGSDNIFLSNGPDCKNQSEFPEGQGTNKPSPYPPLIPSANRRCPPNFAMNSSSSVAEITMPVTSCTPIMSIHHAGLPIEVSQMPPPSRPGIRPAMTVPNLMFKTLPPSVCMQLATGTTRTETTGTIIFENSNSGCGQSLPSALPLHSTPDTNQHFPLRPQQPFSADNIVMKTSDGVVDLKPGSLPSSLPSSFHASSLPGSTYVSVTSRNSKAKSIYSAGPSQHNNKFNKSAPIPREKEDDSHFVQPSTATVIKTSASCNSPMVHTSGGNCHHSGCSCNCNNSSPPPQQSNPTTPLPYMHGFIPPVFYPYSHPRGFMPPNSTGNGTISPNMHTGFGFLGNPSQLPNGLAMHEHMRFPGQASFPSAMPQHLQAQSNQPNNSHLVGGPPQFVNYHGNYVLPMSSGPSGKPLSCYNCGNIGHQGSTCKEVTMEEMSKNGQFRLNYAPNQKDSDSCNDLKS